MVEEVNKIIYNMLISGRGVLLPDVGVLFIERQGARKIAKDRLLSPRNAVAFSSQEQAPSLVDEIVAIAGCGVEQAEDIYERWIAKTREGDVVTIGGVGVLRGKSFVADKAFASAINPKGVKTLVVRRKSSHAWIYAVFAVAVLVALGFFAYLQWGEELGFGVGVHNTKTESVVEAEPTPAEINTEASATPEVTPSTVAATVAEQPVKSGGRKAYYVVAGVFSNEQNAARAVEQVRSKIEDVACEVMPFGDKYMVSAYSSNSREDCNTFIRSWRDVYPDMWVYNKKN